MRLRLSLVLLTTLGGCATYYDRWIDTTGQNRPESSAIPDRDACLMLLYDDGDMDNAWQIRMNTCMKERGWNVLPRQVSGFSQP